MIVVDEGTLADLLDPATDADLLADLASIHTFLSEDARDAYLEQRWPRRGD